MKLRSLPTILHNTEGGEGGKATETPPPEAPPADINKRIEGLLKAHGDANGAVRALLQERDQAHAQLADTRTKIPKEGHRVIDPDTGKLFDEYAALGLKPADIKAALAERDDLKVKDEKRTRSDHLGRVAAIHGFKPSVLTDRAEADKLDIVIVEDKDPRTQKPVQVAKVKGKDEKGNETLTPLEEYASKNWGDYLPALKGTAAPAPAPLGSPPAPGGPPRPPVRVKGGDRPRSNSLS